MYCEVGQLDKVILILEEVNKFCELYFDVEWMKQWLKFLNIFVFMFWECFQLDFVKEYMKLCVDVIRKVYGEKIVLVVERLCNFGVILYD